MGLGLGAAGLPFLRFEGRSFSYGRAERESNRLGQALRADGRTAALLAGNEPFFSWPATVWEGIDIETKMHVRFLTLEPMALCY